MIERVGILCSRSTSSIIISIIIGLCSSSSISSSCGMRISIRSIISSRIICIICSSGSEY